MYKRQVQLQQKLELKFLVAVENLGGKKVLDAQEPVLIDLPYGEAAESHLALR